MPIYCLYLYYLIDNNFISVKLSGPEGSNSGNGTVLYYLNDTWSLICDDGFDDLTARKVCRELGFADGRAICCSAFGNISVMLNTSSPMNYVNDY